MARAMKVWHYGGGRSNFIVATQTKKAAMEAFRISRSEAQNFMHESLKGFELALSEPGVVWRQDNSKYGQPWERVEGPTYPSR